jgi:peptidoglycan/LPS O-acetylase OafA/YrhL
MHNAPQVLLNLPLCFLLGVLAYLYRDYIPLSIAAAVLMIAACFFIEHPAFYAISWSYAAFVVGFHPTLFAPRLMNVTDLSYGIYITSFPIQQLLVLNNPSIQSSWLFTSSLLLTLIASAASWQYFEKPGLSYRGKFFKSVSGSFRKLKTKVIPA